MIGHTSYPARKFAPDVFTLSGSFQPGGAGQPLAANFRFPRGQDFTVLYTATGIYTVTLGAGLSWPAREFAISLTYQGAVLATDRTELILIGESSLNSATKSFVIQSHRAGTAFEIPNTAGNRIHFKIEVSNNTGK